MRAQCTTGYMTTEQTSSELLYGGSEVGARSSAAFLHVDDMDEVRKARHGCTVKQSGALPTTLPPQN